MTKGIGATRAIISKDNFTTTIRPQLLSREASGLEREAESMRVWQLLSQPVAGFDGKPLSAFSVLMSDLSQEATPEESYQIVAEKLQLLSPEQKFELFNASENHKDRRERKTSTSLLVYLGRILKAHRDPTPYLRVIGEAMVGETPEQSITPELRARLLKDFNASTSISNPTKITSLAVLMTTAAKIIESGGNATPYLQIVERMMAGISVEERFALLKAMNDSPTVFEKSPCSTIVALITSAKEIADKGHDPLPYLEVIGRMMNGIDLKQFDHAIKNEYAARTNDLLKVSGDRIAKVIDSKTRDDASLTAGLAEIERIGATITMGFPFRTNKIINPVIKLAETLIAAKSGDKRKSESLPPLASFSEAERNVLVACHECLGAALIKIEQSTKESRGSGVSGYIGSDKKDATEEIQAIRAALAAIRSGASARVAPPPIPTYPSAIPLSQPGRAPTAPEASPVTRDQAYR